MSVWGEYVWGLLSKGSIWVSLGHRGSMASEQIMHQVESRLSLFWLRSLYSQDLFRRLAALNCPISDRRIIVTDILIATELLPRYLSVMLCSRGDPTHLRNGHIGRRPRFSRDQIRLHPSSLRMLQLYFQVLDPTERFKVFGALRNTHF